MKQLGIAVIGRVAEGVQLLDGQTVKTRVLCEELRRQFPDKDLIVVDTYQYIKRIPIILLCLFRAFFHSEHIFVLLSRNGRTYFFPLIVGLNRVFHRRIYHDVIGGALPEEARKSPGLCRSLRSFEVNWVETEQMRDALSKLGVSNVEVLHNFKRLPLCSPEQLPSGWEEPFVFTMFSRVLREKGMDRAAEAIAEVNHRFGRTRAILHIYGPVEPPYQAEFDELLRRYRAYVTYQGCVPYQDSVDALGGSFMLLFPSTYPGEGMPGTILDAFSAGLPVIATDWHFNAVLVRNGETGFCYDWKRPELLAERIAYAVEHPDEIDGMRVNCLKEAADYSADAAMERIVSRMKGESVECAQISHW